MGEGVIWGWDNVPPYGVFFWKASLSIDWTLLLYEEISPHSSNVSFLTGKLLLFQSQWIYYPFIMLIKASLNIKLTFILMLKLVQWMQDISDQTHGWNEFDHSSREDRVVEEDSILHVQGVHKMDIICEHPLHISLQCAILFLLSWYCYLGLQWK